MPRSRSRVTELKQRQRQPDMSGPGPSGLAVIQNSQKLDILRVYIQHRYQVLTKIRGLPNPAAVLSISFEAILAGIQVAYKINRRPECSDWMTDGHRALRSWYCKLQVGLPDGPHQAVEAWANSPAGNFILRTLHNTIIKGWRRVPFDLLWRLRFHVDP